MKKLNRRTRVLILTLVMAALLAVVYLAGLLVPEEAVASIFSMPSSPQLEHLFGTDTLGAGFVLADHQGPVCQPHRGHRRQLHQCGGGGVCRHCRGGGLQAGGRRYQLDH